MKQISILSILLAVMVISFSSCKKDKVEEGETSEFPAPNPSSSLTVVMDGKTYTLKVIGQAFTVSDTAKVRIDATSPEFTVRLRSNTFTHTKGIGDYFLICCSNDIFEKTLGTKRHWETERAGSNLQKGNVKITSADEKGYEGTFEVYTKDGSSLTAVKKTFPGTFKIIY